MRTWGASSQEYRRAGAGVPGIGSDPLSPRGELVLRVVGGGQGGGTVRKAESAKFQVHGSKSEVERRAGFARQKWTIVAVTGLLLIAATIVAVRYFFPSQPPTPNP